MKSTIYPYYQRKVKGGPLLLVKERHDLPIAAINFWVAAGSAHEEPPVNGISHYFEHIFFKGTDKHPKGEMDRQIKAMGGYSNAATSYEFTHYYVVVPSWHVERALDLLSDAFLRPSVRREEVERERMIIREEIRRRDDNPGARLFTLLQEEIFGGSPYAMPILGSEESLENIGVDELEEYYDARYNISSLIVVIVGDADCDHIEAMIGDLVAGKRKHTRDGMSTGRTVVLSLEESRNRFEEKDINQVYAAVGFQTPGISDMESLPALELAALILGGGKSSRLYKRMLEREKLVSSVSAWHMELRSAGVLGIDTVFRPGREGEVNRCLFEEIGRLAREGPDEEELARARVVLRSGFLFENETNAAISGTLGYYEVEFGGVAFALNYLEALERVSGEEIRWAVERYVHDQPFARVMVGPGGDGAR
jgi:zinc protease